MNYIVRYENFNESKCISDSCEKITNSIWNDIEGDINNLLTNEINFDIDEPDFKSKNISLKYNISKGDENLCNAQTHLRESKLINGYLTDLYINIDTWKKLLKI